MKVTQSYDRIATTPTPKVVWHYDAGDTVMNRPSLDQDSLVVGTRYGKLLSIDADSGEENWEQPLGEDIITDIGRDNSGNLIVAHGRGTVELRSLEDGQPLWSQHLRPEGEEAHCVVGRAISRGPKEELLVGTTVFERTSSVASVAGHGYVVKLDPDSGREQWRFRTAEGVGAAPVADSEGTVYTGTYGKEFYAIDHQGRQLWVNEENKGWVSSTPVLFENLVLFSSWDKKVFALDRATGEKKWETAVAGRAAENPVLHRESLILTSEQGRLYSLNARSGAVEWERSLGSGRPTSPALDEAGHLFVGAAGSVHAYDADTGLKSWEFRVREEIDGAPVIGPEGVVYATTKGGRILALDPKQLDYLVADTNQEEPPIIEFHEDYLQIGDFQVAVG